jgi:hypothetical protein
MSKSVNSQFSKRFGVYFYLLIRLNLLIRLIDMNRRQKATDFATMYLNYELC